MSNNSKVNIVLLNYNNPSDTIECINSILKSKYRNYNVVIVDNASTDNSSVKIKLFLKNKNLNNKARFLQSGLNGGYAYGNNVGIKHALKSGADYILLLNNDTIVHPDFLDPLIQMCEKNKNIGLASGTINILSKPKIIWYQGGNYNKWLGKIQHYNYFKNIGTPLVKKPTTFISGCMMLIPSSTVEKVGLLDENYFMYVEDLEYSQRVLSNGYTLHINEESKIYHKVSTNKKDAYNKFSVYWKVRNTNYYILSSAKNLHQFILAELIYNLNMAYRLIVMNKYSLLSTMIIGIKDGYKMKVNSIT